jgi:hypothetical protein
MIDLQALSRPDVARCAATMLALGAGAVSMEDAARRVVQFFYENFGDPRTSCRSCALVRLYKTHPFGKLDEGARSFVEKVSDSAVLTPESPCLALLASTGDKASWNLVESSVRHRAVALAGTGVPACLSHLLRLVTETGVDDGPRPDPAGAGERPGKGEDVFFVPEALGSPEVPDQGTFVEPYGIRSMLAFRGRLPSREAFAVVLFAKVPLPAQAPRRFAAVARAMTRALSPFADATLFT